MRLPERSFAFKRSGRLAPARGRTLFQHSRRGASALKKRGTVFAIACGLALAMVVHLVAHSAPQAPAQRPAPASLVTGSTRPLGVAATHVKVSGFYGNLPLPFEANLMHIHSPVTSLSRAARY